MPRADIIDEVLGRQALAFAVCHVNASIGDPITVDRLLDALTSEVPPSDVHHHLRAFFDGTDIETLSDLARSRLVTYGSLDARARAFLPADHPTLEWLHERAEVEVA